MILAPIQGRQHLPSCGTPVVNLSFGRLVRLYCHLIGVAAIVNEVVVGIPDGVYPSGVYCLEVCFNDDVPHRLPLARHIWSHHKGGGEVYRFKGFPSLEGQEDSPM